jgi:hypothetical protein
LWSYKRGKRKKVAWWKEGKYEVWEKGREGGRGRRKRTQEEDAGRGPHVVDGDGMDKDFV